MTKSTRKNRRTVGDLTFGVKYTIMLMLKEGGTFCVIKISKKGIEYAYK